MTEKLILIAFLFGGVLIYALLDPRTNGRYDLRTALDRYIPFVPAFVYPYLGLFVFVPVALLLLILTPLAKAYLLALDVAMYTGAVSWLLFPATMHPGSPAGETLAERLVMRIYHGDAHANACPSAHVFSSVISAYYLSAAFPLYAWLAWVAGAVVAVSTVFIKRHHAVDVLAGILWAVAAIVSVQYFLLSAFAL